MKKVKIINPYSADKAPGEVVNLYGVPFQVVESSPLESVLTAELPDDEAEAMIEAGRVVACDDEPTGPTRDEMKTFLTEKGIQFAGNISNAKLAELFAAAQAE